MGKKAREIVAARTNVEEIIEALHRAYADEWLSHYNYLLAANLAAGLQSDVVAQRLRTQATDELAHAERIARRLLQLGSEPVRDLDQLRARANCHRFALPEDPTDIKGIIRAVLDMERCSIEVYAAMVDRTRAVDAVTHELAEALLTDEVDDEEEFETLLAE